MYVASNNTGVFPPVPPIGSLRYIEANEMSAVLRSLLYRMGRRSTVSYTYSLFVLNTPARTGHPAQDDPLKTLRGEEPPLGPGGTAMYGYREGFSVQVIGYTVHCVIYSKRLISTS